MTTMTNIDVVGLLGVAAFGSDEVDDRVMSLAIAVALAFAGAGADATDAFTGDMDGVMVLAGCLIKEARGA